MADRYSLTATARNRGYWVEVALAIFVPAAMAVAMFFSWIVLINYLQIPYWLYYERTIYLIYFVRSVDPIIWIVSSVSALVLLAGATRARSIYLWPAILVLWLGIVLGTLGSVGLLGELASVAGSVLILAGCGVGALVATRGLTPDDRKCFTTAFLLALSLLILAVELGSLTYNVLSAFHPGIEVGRSWELLEMQLWYTAFPLVPFLYVASLFSWVWAPLITKVTSRSTPKTCTGTCAKARAHPSWLVAACAYIILSLFLGYYPYFHDPTYNLVGTDIYFNYAVPAQRVFASQSWIGASAKERHPVVVLGIAVLSRLSGMSVESVLRVAYVALILAFGAAVFLLVLRTSGNKNLASISALMATISPLTPVGLFTGIVANWLAMIIWVLSFISLSANRGRSPHRYAIPILGLGVGSLVVLFVHPWTWMAMMVALVAYVVITILFRLKDAVRDAAIVLVVILLNAGALALSLLVLSKAQGWRVAEAFSFVQRGLGSGYFGLGTWEILVFFSQIWGQFLNPMLLLLSILGALFLARRRDRYSAIVFAWLIAACATNLLAAPVGYNPVAVGRGETQIFRAFFLTPFQILSAPAFLLVGSKLETRLSGTTHNRASRVVLWAVLGVIFLATLNGALRAMFPLLTDPHNCPRSSC
jgi:hypothetical protein